MPNWTIRLYDSTTCVDEWQKVGSEQAVKNLLQQLAAKYLNEREIVESGKALLEVRTNRGGNKVVLACGQNPYYTAEVMKEDERAIEEAKREPFPADSFSPEHFPSLFPKKTEDTD